ncbi:hypothetical protein BSA16_22410 [Micromonospora sp. Rc5]|nr:hypothetical protein BSA16_22410 [Micromonospora sp. Rc5]
MTGQAAAASFSSRQRRPVDPGVDMSLETPPEAVPAISRAPIGHWKGPEFPAIRPGTGAGKALVPF